MKAGNDIGPLLPRYVFWDVKRENLDFSKDKSFIISRIFERGKLEDVLGIIHIYGKREAGDVLRSNKYLNRQGLYLAHTLWDYHYKILSPMLNLNTIDPPLYQVLLELSKLPALDNFTLVGGTALALQLGHRKSDDLDFFTDHSFDIREVKNAIFHYNPKVEFIAETSQGFSFTLPLPGDEEEVRKLDIYNWAVKFIRPFHEEGHVQLASLEDIAAFKMDAIRYRKEKKDYVDLAVLLDKFSFAEMLGFYREKFPMNDSRLVPNQVLDNEGLIKSVDPEMLVDFSPEQAFTKVQQKVNEYSQTQTENKQLSEETRWQKISEMLEKKKERERLDKGKSL